MRTMRKALIWALYMSTTSQTSKYPDLPDPKLFDFAPDEELQQAFTENEYRAFESVKKSYGGFPLLSAIVPIIEAREALATNEQGPLSVVQQALSIFEQQLETWYIGHMHTAAHVLQETFDQLCQTAGQKRQRGLELRNLWDVASNECFKLNDDIVQVMNLEDPSDLGPPDEHASNWVESFVVIKDALERAKERYEWLKRCWQAVFDDRNAAAI